MSQLDEDRPSPSHTPQSVEELLVRTAFNEDHRGYRREKRGELDDAHGHFLKLARDEGLEILSPGSSSEIGARHLLHDLFSRYFPIRYDVGTTRSRVTPEILEIAQNDQQVCFMVLVGLRLESDERYLCELVPDKYYLPTKSFNGVVLSLRENTQGEGEFNLVGRQPLLSEHAFHELNFQMRSTELRTYATERLKAALTPEEGGGGSKTDLSSEPLGRTLLWTELPELVCASQPEALEHRGFGEGDQMIYRYLFNQGDGYFCLGTMYDPATGNMYTSRKYYTGDSHQIREDRIASSLNSHGGTGLLHQYARSRFGAERYDVVPPANRTQLPGQPDYATALRSTLLEPFAKWVRSMGFPDPFEVTLSAVALPRERTDSCLALITLRDSETNRYYLPNAPHRDAGTESFVGVLVKLDSQDFTWDRKSQSVLFSPPAFEQSVLQLSSLGVSSSIGALIQHRIGKTITLSSMFVESGGLQSVSSNQSGAMILLSHSGGEKLLTLIHRKDTGTVSMEVTADFPRSARSPEPRRDSTRG